MKLVYIWRPTTIVVTIVTAMLAMARVTIAVVINVAMLSFSARRDKDISNHESNSYVGTTAKNLKGGRTSFDIISVVSCPAFAHKSYRLLTDFT